MSSVVNKSDHDTWRVLDLSYPSAFLNLALEEALARSTLSKSFQPTLRLWVNPPTVVVGRFQDVATELDLKLCEQDGIRIARRFTGGGTVFHDKGNLNFTIVTRRPRRSVPTTLHEFNCSVIIHMLSRFGVESVLDPPNSIMIAGKKISGAAAALGRHFTLWHASILVSTNTALLKQILSTRRSIPNSGFVPSKWQPVTTIETAVGMPVSVEEVKLQLLRSFEELFEAQTEAEGLSDEEEQRTRSLHDEKYSSPDWNFLGLRRETL